MTKAKFQLLAIYAAQLIMLAGAATALWQQRGTAAGLTIGALALTLIPALLRLFWGVRTPEPFQLSLVGFVFATLFLGEVHGLYRYFWWWDGALHFISGLMLGVVGFLLVYVMNGVADTQRRMRPAFVAFFSFCFAVTIGAFWEVLEFVLDIFFTLEMQTEKSGDAGGLTDSMTDLLTDGAGALITAAVVYWQLKHPGRRVFIGRWVNEFIFKNPQLCGNS